MLSAALKRFYQPLAIGFIASSMILSTHAAVAADTLTGAGSTAIYPVLSKWAESYKKETGTEINYQSIGSGGGIKQIMSKTVAFADSDKPLTPDELNKSNLVQFPSVIIAITPVVNLPGVKAGEMVLNGSVLADIYLGKITNWNSPAIHALNPGMKLPDMSDFHRTSFRRFRHHVQLHQLPVQSQPGMERKSGFRHRSILAWRCGWQGQRRCGRLCEADCPVRSVMWNMLTPWKPS